MKIVMMLADAAQVADGKLYILGGGWSVTSTPTPPLALAVKIDVPWDRAGIEHTWSCQLLDADGRAVHTAEGEPVGLGGGLQVTRPDGLPAGTAIDSAIAVNMGPLGLPPGRFEWRFEIDGDVESCSFSVRPGE